MYFVETQYLKATTVALTFNTKVLSSAVQTSLWTNVRRKLSFSVHVFLARRRGWYFNSKQGLPLSLCSTVSTVSTRLPTCNVWQCCRWLLCFVWAVYIIVKLNGKMSLHHSPLWRWLYCPYGKTPHYCPTSGWGPNALSGQHKGVNLQKAVSPAQLQTAASKCFWSVGDRNEGTLQHRRQLDEWIGCSRFSSTINIRAKCFKSGRVCCGPVGS